MDENKKEILCFVLMTELSSDKFKEYFIKEFSDWLLRKQDLTDNFLYLYEFSFHGLLMYNILTVFERLALVSRSLALWESHHRYLFGT